VHATWVGRPLWLDRTSLDPDDPAPRIRGPTPAGVDAELRGIMGIFDFIKGEFIHVIEWTDDSADTLVFRFPVRDHAIKMGAQLTVREGQAAVFVNEGQLADVFTPGRYELTTANLPILTKLNSWSMGFESPFKAEVYFVDTTLFTDQKWGTQNPVTLRDAEIGPVRVRAFGTYAYRVTDPARFMQEVVGTDGRFTTADIQGQLRSHVISSFTDTLGEAKVPVLDLAAHYKELGGTLLAGMQADFDTYGLGLAAFLIENISLPPEVAEMLDKRTSMGILGDMGKFAQFQAAQAMEAAAKNPGGGASEGIGLGAGLAMGQAMASAMGGANAPAPANDLGARLARLKGLLDGGLIDQADFDRRKAEILAEI
jgi:membrane protease subunit (stomatin/prohibitin family)